MPYILSENQRANICASLLPRHRLGHQQHLDNLVMKNGAFMSMSRIETNGSTPTERLVLIYVSGLG